MGERLTQSQAAKWVGCSAPWIAKATKAGLRCQRQPDGRVLYDTDDLSAWNFPRVQRPPQEERDKVLVRARKAREHQARQAASPSPTSSHQGPLTYTRPAAQSELSFSQEPSTTQNVDDKTHETFVRTHLGAEQVKAQLGLFPI